MKAHLRIDAVAPEDGHLSVQFYYSTSLELTKAPAAATETPSIWGILPQAVNPIQLPAKVVRALVAVEPEKPVGDGGVSPRGSPSTQQDTTERSLMSLGIESSPSDLLAFSSLRRPG